MNPLIVFAGVCVFYTLSAAPWSFIFGSLLAVFGVYAFLSSRLNAPPMSTRRKLMMASWSAPSEGTIYGSMTCNAEPLLAWLAEKEKKGEKVSVTSGILKACGLALRFGPNLNSAIAFGKFVPHKSIDISCLVALDDGKDLASAKITHADERSVVDIQNELKKKAERLRKHQDQDFEASKPLMRLLPVFLIEPISYMVGYLTGSLGIEIAPLGLRPYPFGSCMVTSVGMFGVESACVPFTPFARVPLLVMIGAITKKAVVIDDKLTIQSQINLGITLDHRYVDGTEAARIAKHLRKYVEQPQFLDEPDTVEDVLSKKTS